MKKIITTLALISLLAVPMISLAVPTEVPTPIPDPTSFTTVGGLRDLLVTISAWIFTGVLIIAGIFLVVAGYFFVTGGGSPEKVNQARQMLINALIGVAVALASKGLISVISDLLGTTTQ